MQFPLEGFLFVCNVRLILLKGWEDMSQWANE